MSEMRDDAGLSTPEVGPAPRQVDSTGAPRLDLVLGGGIPRGSLLMVVGPPGSGKTTLAAQMAFAAARAGRDALILTAFSEPTSKLIAHLRAFTFFDEALVGGPVRILSLEQFLPRGLASTAEELLALTWEERAGLVLLDGFTGIREADSDPQAARQFLYQVGSALSVRGTTTLITSEADPRDQALFPEATTADIIVGLHYSLDGVRQRRGLEVVKARGAAPLPGLHGLALNDDGAVVYPRLEATVRTAGQTTVATTSAARVSSGVPDLDTLLGGGLNQATTTLVTGSLGAGKTFLGLHFALAGLRVGESVVFAGFRETEEQFLLKADVLADGATLRAALQPDGGLTLLHWPPVELDPDIVADEILATLDRTGARRLVVDSVAELERAAGARDPRRVNEYLAALVVALRRRGVTTLVIREARRTVAEVPEYPADPVSMMADNVIVLRQVVVDNRLRRTLAVVKMRFSAHDVALHEFRIAAPQGIQLQPLSSGATVPGTLDPTPENRQPENRQVDGEGQAARARPEETA